MKIKDALIDRYIAEYCAQIQDTDRYITSDEIAAQFFSEQDTADILDYVNSRSPLDEVYLTQAMIECADRAGLLDEWMHTFDTDGKLWEQIWRRLRKMLREQKKAAAMKETDAAKA